MVLANVSCDIGDSKVLSIYRNFSPADNVFRTQKKKQYLCLPMLSEVRNGALKYDSRAPIILQLPSFRLRSVVIRELPALVGRFWPLGLQWGKRALILTYTAGTLRSSLTSVHGDQGKRFASSWQLGFTSEGCWRLTTVRGWCGSRKH